MASTMFYHGCHHAHEDFHHQQSHFLEACSGCQKPLGHNRDIFMYRGITAYCSNECRQEQIEMDEAEERSWKRRAHRNAANAAANKAPAAADSKSAVRVS